MTVDARARASANGLLTKTESETQGLPGTTELRLHRHRDLRRPAQVIESPRNQYLSPRRHKWQS